jgi:hypothetical protein
MWAYDRTEGKKAARVGKNVISTLDLYRTCPPSPDGFSHRLNRWPCLPQEGPCRTEENGFGELFRRLGPKEYGFPKEPLPGEGGRCFEKN